LALRAVQTTFRARYWGQEFEVCCGEQARVDSGPGFAKEGQSARFGKRPLRQIRKADPRLCGAIERIAPFADRGRRSRLVSAGQ